jgi:hypothetical protein
MKMLAIGSGRDECRGDARGCAWVASTPRLGRRRERLLGSIWQDDEAAFERGHAGGVTVGGGLHLTSLRWEMSGKWLDRR